jgi:hypothetical protein
VTDDPIGEAAALQVGLFASALTQPGGHSDSIQELRHDDDRVLLTTHSKVTDNWTAHAIRLDEYFYAKR